MSIIYDHKAIRERMKGEVWGVASARPTEPAAFGKQTCMYCGFWWIGEANWEVCEICGKESKRNGQG